MILETRVFNRRTGKMVYFEPLVPHAGHIIAMSKNEPTLVLDAKDPIMLKTPILTGANVPLWEADVCDCSIITSFGLVKDRGIIVWRGDMNRFILQVSKTYEDQREFSITDIVHVGNMYEHPQLLKNAKTH